MILYDNNFKRFYMATEDELLQMRVDDTNFVMKPDPLYTVDTFRLTNHYVAFQIDLIEYKRQAIMFLALERMIIENLNKNQADIRLDGPGSYIKIKQDLEAIEEVQEASLGSPEIFNDRALIGVAIRYTDDIYIDDPTVNQKIANALALAEGVGIYTKQDPESRQFYGTLANGQPWEVYWRLLVDKPIMLRYEYNLEFGKFKPADEDLKKILIEVINEDFKPGTIFKPEKYSMHFAFSYFDRRKLLWKDSTSAYSSLNTLTNYYEKWTFNPETDIVFDNVGNVTTDG